MKPETKTWLSHFNDALYLYKGHRYSMAVYCCHQALEKILKAAIVEFAGKVPPKSHNLDSLARETTLSMPTEWFKDLAEITRHFWRVRYPDFQQYTYTSREKIQPTIDKTKEVYQWMSKQFGQQ